MRKEFLSKREAEIAELVAWGAEFKEIADRLNISRKTVDNTIQSIHQKLNVNKNTEISAWYFCSKFHISFDLSPLKKQIIATIFLLVFVFGEYQNINIPLRRGELRESRREIRCNRARRD